MALSRMSLVPGREQGMDEDPALTLLPPPHLLPRGLSLDPLEARRKENSWILPMNRSSEWIWS